jgi:molybdopterin-guanine dinucleotide biosynthesis protein A
MGPLGGLYSALRASSNKYVYLLACDMPNINLEYIKHLKEKILSSHCDICITRTSRGVEPFNAFYSKEIIRDIRNTLDDGKKSFNEFLKNQSCFYIEEEEARIYSADLRMFSNINTPEDLESYTRLIDHT